MLVHIRRENWGLGIRLADPVPEIVTAWCGDQALVFDDGEVIPGDFDFVMERHARSATCTRCRGAMDAMTAVKALFPERQIAGMSFKRGKRSDGDEGSGGSGGGGGSGQR